MIARVDRKGNIIGKIEKWEAHKKGILHRGFTVVVYYQDYIILQHRKHPAFDGTFDATISSHQIFIDGKLQDTIDATYEALRRELNIAKSDLISKPENLGFVYYKAKDPTSEFTPHPEDPDPLRRKTSRKVVGAGFTEHEIDDVLVVKVKKMPTPNYNFAYGLSLVKRSEILNKKSRIYKSLAPWVKVMIANNML